MSVTSHFREHPLGFGDLAFEGDAERRAAAIGAPDEGLQVADGFVAPSGVAAQPT
jgi:hypothetical protein